jgi:hypothetical protein
MALVERSGVRYNSLLDGDDSFSVRSGLRQVGLPSSWRLAETLFYKRFTNPANLVSWTLM